MNKFFDLKIKNQLIMLVITALFLILFVQIFLFLSFNTVLQKNTEKTFDIILNQVQNNFNNYVDEIESNNSKFVSTVEISPFVHAYYSAKESEKKQSFHLYLLETMNSDYFSLDHIEGTAIILFDGTELLSDSLVNNTEILNQIKKEYALINSNNARLNKSFFTKHFINRDTGKKYFAYISPIQDKEGNLHSPFALFISIYDLDTLYDSLHVEESNESYILLVEDKNVLACNNSEWDNKVLSGELAQFISLGNNSELIKHGNKKYFTQVRKLSINNWRLVNLIPYWSISKNFFSLIPIGFFILLSAALIIISVSYFITWSITMPVNTIIEQLQSIDENDLQKRLYTPVNNEVGIITSHINNMLIKIETMNVKVFNTQKKLYQMEILKKQAELSFYQNQINPHFLYNTLECIRSMADVYGAEEISSISNSMAKIFRYASKADSTTTLSKEIDCVKEYFSIMSLRFPSRFSLITNIDKKLHDVLVVRMILQPIVENAIKHGLKAKRKNGIVFIKGYMVDKTKYYIEIVDNGIGMNTFQLKELMNNLSVSEGTEKTTGIGLSNIHNRIQIAYGYNYGIEVKSREKYWTKVILKLPVITD